MTDLCANDALTLAGMLRRREVSAREVAAAHIDRIEAHDGPVNAVVTRCFDRALARAAEADDALARGEALGLLHGLPVAHKDLAETAGVRTTYGSPLFSGHVPDFDALVVERMSGAGAISLGKTNTPEFAAHTVNPVSGATRNPYDLTAARAGAAARAAALAARMICLADGATAGRQHPGELATVGLRHRPAGHPGGHLPTWPTPSASMGRWRTVADARPVGRRVQVRPVPFRWTRHSRRCRASRRWWTCWPGTCGVKRLSADLGLPVDPAVRDAGTRPAGAR